MATRFYLPSTGDSPCDPTPDAAWDDIGSLYAVMSCVTTKIDSAATDVEVTGNDDQTDGDYLIFQWVSDPIAAQTIQAQTIKFQMRSSEFSPANNLYQSLCIRVLSGDCTSVTGTLVPLTRDTLELTTALVNRSMAPTCSEVEANEGDRIVIEVGQGGDPTPSGEHDGILSIGDDSGTDLGENDTDTDAYNPWIEFVTDTLEFAGGAETVSLSTASITANGQSLVLAPGAVTKSLNTAALTAGGQALSLSMGEATIALGTAALTLNGQSIVVSLGGGAQTVVLDTALLTANGQALSLTMGAVSTELNTAALTAGGQGLSLSMGAVSTGLDTATMTANGQALTLAPGVVAIAMDTAALIASGQALTLSMGEATIALDTALITANGQAVSIIVPIAIVKVWTLHSRSTAWTVEERTK